MLPGSNPVNTLNQPTLLEFMPGNEFTDDFNESTSPVHWFSPVIVDCRERVMALAILHTIIY